MQLAKDFRQAARAALAGKWLMALLVGLVASLLGAAAGSGPQLKFNISLPESSVHLNFAGQDLLLMGTSSEMPAGLLAGLLGALGIFTVIVLAFAVVYFILGSIVGVGYASFNLHLTDGIETGFDRLFAYFSYWKTAAAAKFLTGLYIFLWSLLFVIPGIVKTYSYAMTNYILAEHPDLTATEAIEQSKTMMYGNRWRLFCLQFSFIGWDFLAALTFGIGNLWLTPYKQAATAAFYRDISGTQAYVID